MEMLTIDKPLKPKSSTEESNPSLLYVSGILLNGRFCKKKNSSNINYDRFKRSNLWVKVFWLFRALNSIKAFFFVAMYIGLK